LLLRRGKQRYAVMIRRFTGFRSPLLSVTACHRLKNQQLFLLQALIVRPMPT
jgi:hypothetical protein